MNDDQVNNGTQASELYSKVEEAIIGAQASQVYQGASQNNHDEDDDDRDDDDDGDDDDADDYDVDDDDDDSGVGGRKADRHLQRNWGSEW